ncbi:MAG: insulinase family protein [Oscillospiraceae bacterium]|jgi:predicted Zn-dependent peptidase|nr:insulinase family protein [Oscillospiraceae bacterium]
MVERNYSRIGEWVFEETLPNGLRLRVIEKPHHAKSCAFFVTRYGGMDLRFQLNGQWRDTPAGIAHYLEHKMFDTEDGNALQELAQNGAEPNAFTSNDITAYYFYSTEHFYENLKILLEFVSVPYFTEESVEKEQGIIAQEIRMVEDTPDWQSYTQLMGCLYERSPARVSVAGTVESIREITAETLYDCHRAFYHPGNMVLCVVGNVDAEQVAAIAREVLPDQCGEPIPRDYGEGEALCPVKKEAQQKMEVSMPQFLAGYKCEPPQSGREHLRLSILGDMVCDILFGDSSPLYSRLYEEGLINNSFGGNFDILPGAAYLYVGGDTNEPKKVHEAVTAEAKRLAAEGIDEDFYQRIRRACYGQMIRGLNSFESIAISAAEGVFFDYNYYDFPEVFETITKADVEDFLRRNVTEERSAISLIYPKDFA